MKKPKPRKIPKSECIKKTLHHRVKFEESRRTTHARNAHLRSLIGLPAERSK
jgi:hypothetical protein